MRGVASEIRERQNHHGKPRCRKRCRTSSLRLCRRTDCVSPGRAKNVLQILLAEIDEADSDPASNLVVDGRGNADAARLRDALQSRRDIDAVTEDVVGFDDDIAYI